MFAECVTFSVHLIGTAERIGLSSGQLGNYAELRHRNDLSFLPKCSDETDGAFMLFYFNVWTVGEDFPVAYHVDISVVLYLQPDGVPRDPYSTSYLGYANASRIQGQVEDIIRDEVRAVALKVTAVQ